MYTPQHDIVPPGTFRGKAYHIQQVMNDVKYDEYVARLSQMKRERLSKGLPLPKTLQQWRHELELSSAS